MRFYLELVYLKRIEIKFQFFHCFFLGNFSFIIFFKVTLITFVEHIKMKIKLCSFLTVSFLIESFLFSFTSNSQGIAGFTASPVSSFSPVNVSFTNTSSGVRWNLCENGVYAWKAFVKLNDGEVFIKSGDVTLIR